MAAILHSSPTPYLPKSHSYKGILLSAMNNNSPYIQSSSLSSSSTASSASSHTSLTNTPSSATSSKRIRFAPLPDPRRSVLVTDDGSELPLPEDATFFSCSQVICPTEDSSSNALDTSSLSSSGSASNSKRNSFADSAASTPGTMTPISTSPEDDSLSIGTALANLTSLSNKKSSSSSFTKSLLFRGFSSKKSSASSASSTHSLTPTPSHDNSAPSTKGNGVSMFRTSSRDSDATFGWGLQRWTSAGGKESKEPSWGAPLTRSQSSQSYKGKRSFLSLPSPLSSSSKPKSRPAPAPAPLRAGTGTRMLNGRIYGAPRRGSHPTTNPFANAREDAPEFVEWGYGGMGSVKNANASSTNWSRVQSTQGDDDEDGSGLAWVRKRREEREKAKREAEEKEKRENEEAVKPAAVDAGVHDLRAVTIPAPLRQHHYRSPSRSHIKGAAVDLSGAVEVASPAERQTDEPTIVAPILAATNSDSPSTPESVEDNSSSSESEDDDSAENHKGDDENSSGSDSESDSEDDDEFEQQNHDAAAARKMVLGAGVEKIARHKIDHHPSEETQAVSR